MRNGAAPLNGLTHLQVVWQFRTTSVARIHGDTDVAIRIEIKCSPLEFKDIQVGLNCSNDTQYLSGDTMC